MYEQVWTLVRNQGKVVKDEANIVNTEHAIWSTSFMELQSYPTHMIRDKKRDAQKRLHFVVKKL
jgi:hypothetical protein